MRIFFHIALLYCLASTCQLYGINRSVELTCVSVTSLDDIQLVWQNPADTCSSFTGNYIYASQTPSGPYTLIDSVKVFAQTNYMHVGADAANKDWYYFIITKNDCSALPLSPSDTLRSIRLNVNNPGNGLASLSWNAIHTPLLSSSYTKYHIYKEYPVGTWTPIDSTTNLNYTDSVFLCSATVNYRIEIRDSSGCVSVSSVDGDLFQDAIYPSIPVMDTVSVDTNGFATASWDVNPLGDTRSYVIYQFISNVWTPIDTIYGITNIFYKNDSSAAGNISETYRIAAIDSCGNISPLGNIHNTIHLTQSVNVCSRSAILNWNSYTNWTGGVRSYRIFVRENGGPYTLVDSVNGGTLTYQHTGLKAQTTYCYFIRASSNSGQKTSSSNRICVNAAIPKEPAYLYLKTATISGSNQVSVSWYVDPVSDAIQYRILRSTNMTGPYNIIGTMKVTGGSSYAYDDFTANTGQTSYYYKVIATDTCGATLISSNIGRTIYLQIKPEYDLTNTLSWNEYEEWMGGVNAYNLYRSVDGIWDPIPIASVLPGQGIYTDDIITYVSGKGNFCYYIEALEGNGNPYAFLEKSISNTACLNQLPKLFVPDAFSPNNDGLNDIFLPVTAFIEPGSYTMLIYDRWIGTIIFESKYPNIGWDGTFKGNPVQEGVYPYLITFTATNGNPVKKAGTLSLFR